MPQSPGMPVTMRNHIPWLGWTAQAQALGTAPGVGLEPDPEVTSLPQAASLSGQDWDPPSQSSEVPEGAPRCSYP